MNRRSLLQLPALAMLAACVSSGSPRPPRIRLEGLSPAGGSVFEQTWRVRLRLENPTGRTMRVESLTAALELDGRAFGRGRSRRPVTLGPDEARTIRLRMEGSLLDGDRSESAIADRLSKLDWELTGTVILDDAERSLLDYRETGTLRREDLRRYSDSDDTEDEDS